MKTRRLLPIVFPILILACDSGHVSPVDPGLTLTREIIHWEDLGSPHVGNTERKLELVGFFNACMVETEASIRHLAPGEIEIDLSVRIPPVFCIVAVPERYTVTLEPLPPGTYHVIFRHLVDNEHEPPSSYEVEVLNEVVEVTRRDRPWPL